jgi:hypothetical protein
VVPKSTMSFFHKKRASTKANAANVHMTEVRSPLRCARRSVVRAVPVDQPCTSLLLLLQAEAALAQSDFNIDKILDIQNKFTGGAVSERPPRFTRTSLFARFTGASGAGTDIHPRRNALESL